jgi:hypothetical protein
MLFWVAFLYYEITLFRGGRNSRWGLLGGCGSLGIAFEGHTACPVPSRVSLLCVLVWAASSVTHSYCHGILPHHRPTATEPADHGLKPLKSGAKVSPSVSCFLRSFVTVMLNLTNVESWWLEWGCDYDFICQCSSEAFRTGLWEEFGKVFRPRLDKLQNSVIWD